MTEKAKTSEVEVSIEELDSWIKENQAIIRKGKNWTTDEDAILLKYYESVPIKMLIKHLPGRTEDACRNRAGKLGLSRLR